MQAVPAGRTFTLSNVRIEHDRGSSRAAIALSVPTLGQAMPLGAPFLDLGAMVPLFVGLQNGAGMTSLSVPVPAANHLRGLALVVQAAHADSVRNDVVLSAPVVFSLR